MDDFSKTIDTIYVHLNNLNKEIYELKDKQDRDSRGIWNINDSVMKLQQNLFELNNKVDELIKKPGEIKK